MGNRASRKEFVLYLEHFGFSEKPFNVTPDVRFFYPNVSFIEAQARMAQGIREGQGFVVLTGEVGIGKTTLLRKLMISTEEEKVHGAYFYNTDLSFNELLVFVCEDFGLHTEDTSHVENIKALNQFLVERLDAGEKAVLFIDEAQNLAPEVLEGLRLLSNLETNTQKLLQIVLVGQPELDEKLDRPELRQVKQRIAIRVDLKRLSESELGDYINCRIRTAGCERTDLFTPEAIQWIAHYSEGLPRLVNRICDDSLLLASQFSQPTVQVEIVKQVALNLRLETGQRKPTFELRKLLGETTAREYRSTERKRKLTRAATAAALVFAGIAVVTYIFHLEEFNERFLQERDRVARLIDVLRAAPGSFNDSELAATTKNQKAKPEALIAGAGVPQKADNPAPDTNLVSGPTQTTDEASVQRSEEASVLAKAETTVQPPDDQTQGTSARLVGEVRTAALDAPGAPPAPANVPDQKQVASSVASAPSTSTAKSAARVGKVGGPDQKQVASTAESTPLVRTPESVIVKKGESISQILERAYGRQSDLALDLAHRFNPNVGDLNLVRTGQEFHLPVLDRKTLLQQERDGSSTLIVAAFRSVKNADLLARQWEDLGFKTRVVPKEVARGMSLHRVEIVDLTSPQQIEDAWRLLQRQTMEHVSNGDSEPDPGAPDKNVTPLGIVDISKF